MPEERKMSRGSREKNYTDLECLELIRTIKKYAHIVEWKNTHPGSTYRYNIEERNAAWETICREFNMKTSHVRDFYMSIFILLK